MKPTHIHKFMTYRNHNPVIQHDMVISHKLSRRNAQSTLLDSYFEIDDRLSCRNAQSTLLDWYSRLSPKSNINDGYKALP